MKNKPSHLKKKNFIFKVLLFIFAVFLVGYFGISFYFLNSNDQHNQIVITARTQWLNSNKNRLMYIFTDVFPKAKECKEKITNHNPHIMAENCELKIRKMIDDNLASTLGYGTGEIGRLPIFFIRLKDENTIEKLYQRGGYREEKVDTKGEKMVVEMLEGKRNPFAYPQYNCCGGDDIVPDIPIFNLFLPPRVYLKDFPTEIEQIYLIRDDQNKIVGGLVYLYGD